MLRPRIVAHEADANTTLGTCTVCAVMPPSGSGELRGGMLLLGAGIVVAVGAWFLKTHPLISPLALMIGVLGAIFLIPRGIARLRDSGGGRAFVTGALRAPGHHVEAGNSVTLHLHLQPHHPLHVRSARVELIAADSGANTLVMLDRLETPLVFEPRLDAALTRELTVHLPREWPPTMITPDLADLPRRDVGTQVRVVIDFDAHQLFTVEDDVLVAAPAHTKNEAH